VNKKRGAGAGNPSEEHDYRRMVLNMVSDFKKKSRSRSRPPTASARGQTTGTVASLAQNASVDHISLKNARRGSATERPETRVARRKVT